MNQAQRESAAIIFACVIGLACGIATTVVSTFGVFLGPVSAEFGWTQSQAFGALLAITLVSAPIAPVIGGYVDRYGARRVVLISFVCEAVIFATFALQNGALWSFYARYVALALLGLGTTHVAFARVITLWFDRRRGFALGIALSGIGIGGFAWPLFAQSMITNHGWRSAYLMMAVAVAVIALPVMTFVLRDLPVSSGSTAVAAKTTTATMPGLTLAEAARTRRYWMVLITFFLIGFAVQSVMVHLIPMLKSRGLSPMLAALAQSMLFVAVTTGRLSTGWLMDRFFAPRVALCFLLAPLCGIGLLAGGAEGLMAFGAALLIGLAVGAEVDVLAYVTSQYFGQRNFSSIYGSYYGLYSLSGGIGPLLTAMSVDRTGDYRLALAAHACMLAVSCVLLWRFARFPDWSREGTST